jgi:hypothetical protein
MPERNGNDKRPSEPEALSVEVEEASVRPPETPAERHKQRMDKAASESDDERSKRRHRELHVHKAAHEVHVAAAHAAHPVPPGVKFENLTEEQQHNWNARSAEIASANRAYHLAVRREFEDHRAEDIHVRRVNEAAKETV